MAKNKEILILVQLGSPSAPTPEAVKTYLAEFLGDPRVINLPPLPKALLLHGVILRKRPALVAPKYQKIWLPEGSPLTVWSQRLAQKLQRLLAETHEVHLAMRYGQPGLQDLLTRLKARAPRQISLLPLFPQAAGATTGSIIELFFKELSTWPQPQGVRVFAPFYGHPGFIRAWVEQARPHLAGQDHVLFSFHGLPFSQVQAADPFQVCKADSHCCQEGQNQHCYRAQCFETANLIAKGLGLAAETWSMGFQSRLGKQVWIGPATDQRVRELAGAGCQRLLVISPSFVADCLETLEEIQMGEAKNFIQAGGQALTLVPSLNDSPAFAEALCQLVRGD